MAVYCPLTMDDEVGPFIFRNTMHEGYFCRAMSEHAVEIEFTFRPSEFEVPASGMETDYRGEVLNARVVTTPSAQRLQSMKELNDLEPTPPRIHAACTVQSFRNNQTG
jgi:hypothetical protein